MKRLRISSKKFNGLHRLSLGILMSILLLPSGGLLIFLHFHQGLVKAERWIEREFVSEATLKLNLSHKDFQTASINSFELILEGEYYDIVSSVVHENGVTLTLIADQKESSLYKTILSLMPEDTNTKDALNHCFHFSKSLLCVLPPSYIGSKFSSNKTDFVDSSLLYKNCIKEISLPPPKRITLTS